MGMYTNALIISLTKQEIEITLLHIEATLVVNDITFFISLSSTTLVALLQ